MTEPERDEIPDYCRVCPHRDGDWCNEHEHPIWQAWRMVNGCDLGRVDARRGKV